MADKEVKGKEVHSKKKKTSDIIAIVVVVLIILGAIYYVYKVNNVAPVVPVADNVVPVGETVNIKILEYTFLPRLITINAGDQITWTNADVPTHSVVADDGSFSSGDLVKGASYTYQFKTAGNYSYHCGLHKQNTAKIVVN